MRRIISHAALCAAVLLALPAGSFGQAAPPPRGRLVDIGGWKLHLYETGVARPGAPTVVFEAGAGGSSLEWALVQARVSEFARAVSYDRAGTAWSELGPRPRTMRQVAWELHELLHKAGVKGPYVMVGHSIGGLLIREFTALFPNEVAGMVQVDGTSDDSRLVHNGTLMRLRDIDTGKPIPPIRKTIRSDEKRLSPEEAKQASDAMQHGPPARNMGPFLNLPEDVQRLRLWVLKQPERTADGSEFIGQEMAELHKARLARAHSLGDIPLIVIIAGKREELPDTPEFRKWRVPNEEVNKQDEEMAELSRSGKFVYAKNSGHAVLLEDPAAVVAAVREVVDAARHRTRLRQ